MKNSISAKAIHPFARSFFVIKHKRSSSKPHEMAARKISNRCAALSDDVRRSIPSKKHSPSGSTASAPHRCRAQMIWLKCFFAVRVTTIPHLYPVISFFAAAALSGEIRVSNKILFIASVRPRKSRNGSRICEKNVVFVISSRFFHGKVPLRPRRVEKKAYFSLLAIIYRSYRKSKSFSDEIFTWTHARPIFRAFSRKAAEKARKKAV